MEVLTIVKMLCRDLSLCFGLLTTLFLTGFSKIAYGGDSVSSLLVFCGWLACMLSTHVMSWSPGFKFLQVDVSFQLWECFMFTFCSLHL